MPPPRGAVPVDPSPPGASPAGDIPYLLLTRQGEGEEGRAEETLRPTVGAHPMSRTHRGIFLQNFSTEGSGFPPGKEISS